MVIYFLPAGGVNSLWLQYQPAAAYEKGEKGSYRIKNKKD